MKLKDLIGNLKKNWLSLFKIIAKKDELILQILDKFYKKVNKEFENLTLQNKFFLILIMDKTKYYN